MEIKKNQPNLLNLPYDIRHLIFKETFPPHRQLYIHAHSGTKLVCVSDHKVPAPLLRVCRQLNREAGEYLYNAYLFNVIGLKEDCLQSYPAFQRTMAKYSRQTVRLDAFSNGDHSATMCVCLQAGSSKVPVLKARRRGQATPIEALEHESRKVHAMRVTERRRRYWYFAKIAAKATAACVVVVPVLFAVLLSLIAGDKWSGLSALTFLARKGGD